MGILLLLRRHSRTRVFAWTRNPDVIDRDSGVVLARGPER
jgi:hypothetical protein